MIKSTLRLSRLIVLRGAIRVYDQPFHKGVNIIRGWNSTGKSTIMDFLVYALGYELSSWTEEQLLCDSVVAEVFINNVQLCLKRDISETGQAPMLMYQGDFESSAIDSINWTIYSSRRSGERHSYSQQLFELLGLPQHKNNDEANLTMHQILRLLYVDQLTSTTKLLKADEKYDNVTIRRAIGEYLLGLDDLESHNLRQELIAANKAFEAINGELKAIYNMFGDAASSISRQYLNAEIEEINKNILLLISKRTEIQTSSHEQLDYEAEQKAKELLEGINRLSEKMENFRQLKRDTNIELIDTKHFLNSLEYRLNSLVESKIVNSELGGISFKYCPSCLSEIGAADGGHSCNLCKTEAKEDEKDFAYIQMMNEINFQIKESNYLVSEFQSNVDMCNLKIPAFKRQISILKEEYNDLITFTDNRSALIAEVSTELGYQKSLISNLEDKTELIVKVERLQSKKIEAQEVINDIEEKLEIIKIRNKTRFETVYNSIETVAKTLLMNDGGEKSFIAPEDIFYDFSKDRMAVNGRSKFSASSMVVLKNSIRFSFFLHALNDEGSRIPNFLIMDNIEDKGMVAERSQKFQHLITDACSEIESDFQLIFTTSMIADDLDNTPYCVGPYYPKGSYTLAME